MNPNTLKLITLPVIMTHILSSFALAYSKENIIETIQKTMPSMVTVTAENKQITAVSNKPIINPSTGQIFQPHRVQYSTSLRSGAGIIIDTSGIIVTNTHTISNASKIFVILNDQHGSRLPAKVLGIVNQYDFAFLKISPPYPLQAISWADSDSIQLGDVILSIGHSEILKEAISEGKIIGVGIPQGSKQSTPYNDIKLIHVNLNVYHGDSGGPIFDHKGKFLGLIVAGETKVDRSSFAIPSNKIKEQGNRYLKIPPIRRIPQENRLP